MLNLRTALWIGTLCLLTGLPSAAQAQRATRVGAALGLEERRFDIEGVSREALVFIPAQAKSNSTPVVFVFHGHGGNSRNAARSFALHQHWPEAIVVYPQGLNTPGRLTDPEGKKPGWQMMAGDQGNRDLKFFDAMLAALKQDYRVDQKRVYATGHSNGGAFTYLLWETRGDLLAAVAPSGAAAFRRNGLQLQPKPALHVAGANDPLVKFAWQKLTMEMVRKTNGCASAGKPWAEHGLIYDSPGGTPFISFIHPGKHEFPTAAPGLITRFFKEHSLK